MKMGCSERGKEKTRGEERALHTESQSTTHHYSILFL